jgi:hypothetical protein
MAVVKTIFAYRGRIRGQIKDVIGDANQLINWENNHTGFTGQPWYPILTPTERANLIAIIGSLEAQLLARRAR